MMNADTKDAGTQEKAHKRESQKHRAAFEAWYANDRSCFRILEKVGVSEQTLHNWKNGFHWHERADLRDAEIAQIQEQKAIKARVKRLDDQAKAGTLLRVRGTQHLIKNEIEGTRDAMTAIKMGIEIERQSDGMPDIYVRIANATSLEELNALEAEIESRFASNGYQK